MNSTKNRNRKYKTIKSLNRSPLIRFLVFIFSKKIKSKIINTISYKAIGCLFNPSPKFIPVKNVVSLPKVGSAIPIEKQPILPINNATIIGITYKSPEDDSAYFYINPFVIKNLRPLHFYRFRKRLHFCNWISKSNLRVRIGMRIYHNL